MNDFTKDARRSNLWDSTVDFQKGALSKARKKIAWEAIRDLIPDTVDLAYNLWDTKPFHTWKTMSVFAIDGSKYTLPATEEIRKEFDPESGLAYPGKGHYPQCLVTTVYDVFRRLPIGQTVKSNHSSERKDAMELLKNVPENNVILFDRGYPSYSFIKNLQELYTGYFIIRCPASSTFPAVEHFIARGKKEEVIHINPSKDYLRNHKGSAAPILTVRVIRMVNSDGTVSVLLTNMFDVQTFSSQEINDLYYERYRIEEHFRDEKITLHIEQFHSKSVNGIKQELYAAVFMTLVTRTLMMLSMEPKENGRIQPQFKNAINTLGADISVLASDNPEKALIIFNEILIMMAKIKYTKPQKKKPSAPRVSKAPPNKWRKHRKSKMKENYSYS